MVTTMGTMMAPRAWPLAAVAAITVAFGLQTLRALLSLLVYVLRDGFGWDAIQVGVLALAIFGTGFLAGPATRFLGTSRALTISVAGVGLSRWTAQLWPGEPLADLCLAIAGTLFFILFLFALLEHSRQQGRGATANCSVSFLLGVSLDTLVMGAFGTWDPYWQTGAIPTATVTVMLVAQVASLIFIRVFRELSGNAIPKSVPATPVGVRTSLPWLAIGPVVFLELQVFQNIAGLAAATGWTLPQAFVCIALGNVAGLALAGWLVKRPNAIGWLPTLLLGALLTAALSLHGSQPPIAATTLIVGQICLSALLVIVFAAWDGKAGEEGATPGSSSHGAAMVLLMALLFGFYVSLEIAIPFPRETFLPIAGAIAALAALRAVVPGRPQGVIASPNWWPAVVAALFVIAPVITLLTWDSPRRTAADGYPVRLMTYNLHNGFNTDGHLNMEALAQVIEEQDAGIVALHEVSRGWAINGSMDTLEWLSHRLDMPYLYGPASGTMWGNAILSRYPVIEWGKVDLPPRDLPLLRQFTWAEFDLGQGQQLRVIATHFHHPVTGGEVRLEQAEAVLGFWDASQHTVVLGDLNAEPGSAEVLAFKRAGFSDGLEGVQPRATFPSDDPRQHIDYVLASTDLALTDPAIPNTTASDHFPVLATVHIKR